MTSRSEAGPGSSWNLKANLSFLGTVMHYEGLSGTLGASRGVDWCSRSLCELEDTQLSVLSASCVFPARPETPQRHTSEL